MKFKILLALLPLGLTSSEGAINPGGGTWSNVTVVGLTACTGARCPPKGWVTVTLSADATGSPPVCSSDNRNRVAIGTSEGTGGAFAAAIMQSALLSGMTLTISGTGNCSVDPVIETLALVTESSRRN